jgi:hypothetical protein
MAIIATNADKEDRASQREDRGVNKRVFVVEGSHEKVRHRKGGRPRGKIQWSGNRSDCGHSGMGHSTRNRGVGGTRSRRTDSRTSVGRTNQWPHVEGAAA